jgi:hypothetical protein
VTGSRIPTTWSPPGHRKRPREVVTSLIKPSRTLR